MESTAKAVLFLFSSVKAPFFAISPSKMSVFAVEKGHWRCYNNVRVR